MVLKTFYLLTADLILIVHFAIIVFIVAGQVCIVAGYFFSWNRIRNMKFRVFHLLAIGIVVIQAWAGQLCPLTLWESGLREAGGGQGYSGTFVEHWIGRVVYYYAPQWVFILVYSLFGALVLFSWFWIRPHRDSANSKKKDKL